MISTVYYPSLFPSENWLRLAALCWDKVYTLHYQKSPQIPAEIDDFNNQLRDFIIPQNTVELGRLKSVSQSFKEWLRSFPQAKIELSDELIGEGDWYEMFGDKIPGDILEKLQTRSLVKTSGGRLREAKEMVSSELYEQYERKEGEGKLSFIKRIRQEQNYIDSSPLVIHLPKEIALHYMSLCAAKLAEEKKADLFADREIFAETAIFNPQVRGEITTSIMEAYVPENLLSMEISQIADLREELSAQRLKFQGAVNSLCDEYLKLTTEAELHSIQKRIIEIAEERIDLVENTYRRAHQTAILKGIGMALIPGSVSVISSWLGVGIFFPAAIASAMATATATFLIDREKAGEEMKSSSWSYVLQIGQKVKESDQKP
ncbi:MAG TPA: hypothetical protein VF644_10175 [Pyrinomonadaceae bacterium]|jgi:hypothetical protein